MLADRSHLLSSFCQLVQLAPSPPPEPLPLGVLGSRSVSHSHDVLVACRACRKAVCCIIVAAASTYKLLHGTKKLLHMHKKDEGGAF